MEKIRWKKSDEQIRDPGDYEKLPPGVLKSYPWGPKTLLATGRSPVYSDFG